jgi:hypothetical protein
MTSHSATGCWPAAYLVASLSWGDNFCVHHDGRADCTATGVLRVQRLYCCNILVSCCCCCSARCNTCLTVVLLLLQAQECTATCYSFRHGQA